LPFENFLDARKIEGGTRLEADVCVAGAGAAGITLARRLAAAGYRVCLLEAGGLSIDPKVNALSRVENAGRPYEADTLRLRYFGGTTNHWGGHCTPVQPAVLDGRPWMKGADWPYPFEELEPYYSEAHDVLGIGAYNYDAAAQAQEIGAPLMGFDSGAVESTVSRYNPVRFGQTFGEELNASPNIVCVLYAELSRIDLAEAASDAVTQVEVSSVAGNAFTVAARFYVLACGGIENPRILLNANHQRPAGLGNHSDQVGLYFMEHIWFESGYILPAGGLAQWRHYLREVDHESYRLRFHIALPEEQVRRLEIPNFRAELTAKSAAFWESWSLRNRGLRVQHVASLLSRPFDLGTALKCRDDAPPDVMVLGNYVEQCPNAESRVTLSETKDALGRQQPRLAWKLSKADRDGIVAAHKLISQEVGRASVGRMRVMIRDDEDLELDGATGGAHHMGTTRMSVDPARGVVDPTGRVHNLQNLYVAGSSIFPSCGYANPTLTIVATTLKLADHLESRLGAEKV